MLKVLISCIILITSAIALTQDETFTNLRKRAVRNAVSPAIDLSTDMIRNNRDLNLGRNTVKAPRNWKKLLARYNIMKVLKNFRNRPKNGDNSFSSNDHLSLLGDYMNEGDWSSILDGIETEKDLESLHQSLRENGLELSDGTTDFSNYDNAKMRSILNSIMRTYGSKNKYPRGSRRPLKSEKNRNIEPEISISSGKDLIFHDEDEISYKELMNDDNDSYLDMRDDISETKKSFVDDFDPFDFNDDDDDRSIYDFDDHVFNHPGIEEPGDEQVWKTTPEPTEKFKTADNKKKSSEPNLESSAGDEYVSKSSQEPIKHLEASDSDPDHGDLSINESAHEIKPTTSPKSFKKNERRPVEKDIGIDTKHSNDIFDSNGGRIIANIPHMKGTNIANHYATNPRGIRDLPPKPPRRELSDHEKINDLSNSQGSEPDSDLISDVSDSHRTFEGTVDHLDEVDTTSMPTLASFSDVDDLVASASDADSSFYDDDSGILTLSSHSEHERKPRASSDKFEITKLLQPLLDDSFPDMRDSFTIPVIEGQSEVSQYLYKLLETDSMISQEDSERLDNRVAHEVINNEILGNFLLGNPGQLESSSPIVLKNQEKDGGMISDVLNLLPRRELNWRRNYFGSKFEDKVTGNKRIGGKLFDGGSNNVQNIHGADSTNDAAGFNMNAINGNVGAAQNDGQETRYDNFQNPLNFEDSRFRPVLPRGNFGENSKQETEADSNSRPNQSGENTPSDDNQSGSINPDLNDGANISRNSQGRGGNNRLIGAENNGDGTENFESSNWRSTRSANNFGSGDNSPSVGNSESNQSGSINESDSSSSNSESIALGVNDGDFVDTNSDGNSANNYERDQSNLSDDKSQNSLESAHGENQKIDFMNDFMKDPYFNGVKTGEKGNSRKNHDHFNNSWMGGASIAIIFAGVVVGALISIQFTGALKKDSDEEEPLEFQLVIDQPKMDEITAQFYSNDGMPDYESIKDFDIVIDQPKMNEITAQFYSQNDRLLVD